MSHISLGGLRVFAGADFFPGPGLSWLVGDNGAGKTSVLEALYALGHARSFRCAHFDSALRTGDHEAFVFTEWLSAGGEVSRIACAKQRGGGWRYRMDGVSVARALDLAARAPMLCFEPGAHAIVTGPAERRRRLLDWGLFHVERAPSGLWSEWLRALKQRNEALRRRDLGALDAYDAVVSQRGEQLTAARSEFVAVWLSEATRTLAWLSPELADLEFGFRRGWGRAHAGLLEALRAQRDTDVQLGFTGSGPHRSDIVLRWQGADARERVSRGQSKVIALALVLSLARLFSQRLGRWPLLLLDDLCSELDQGHASRVLAVLREANAQVLITGVSRPEWGRGPADALFHVERGAITPLL
ncbi:DNA replication/repair protein RecF [Aquimonas voraii]|uniref:DNA replication/repair protein RecF n=1 Tax=Aquimonas voraii TaxID=265719 RepID=UPI0015A31A00|nr:DNA replication and repair protein RecF [Aquimonas voraii]